MRGLGSARGADTCGRKLGPFRYVTVAPRVPVSTRISAFWCGRSSTHNKQIDIGGWPSGWFGTLV